MLKIDQKITGYSVLSQNDEPKKTIQATEVKRKNTSLKREEVLSGKTYKLKTPLSECALYITINDYMDDQGKQRPFEIFINSKTTENFQWIVAMTRILSAIFRQNDNPSFIIEELHSVFDPKTGYFSKGKWIPSLVYEIGDIIERHFISIGLLKQEMIDDQQQKLINESFIKMQAVNHEVLLDDGYPASAKICKKCNHRSVVVSSGCEVCLNCSDSRCS